jgi:uncharacterized protein YqgV (UPF0045/DUF77 family)
MKFEIEISMYPLTEDYIPHIKGFIEALKNHNSLEVTTSDMSTRISGDSIKVMEALRLAMEGVLEEMRSAFIIKVIKGK